MVYQKNRFRIVIQMLMVDQQIHFVYVGRKLIHYGRAGIGKC